MDLGLVVRPELDPEGLPARARAAEAAGFAELWLWEDCFLAGGIAAAATALAATERIRVGLGIMPAPLRNAAFAAMEAAALARLHPGAVPRRPRPRRRRRGCTRSAPSPRPS